MRNLQLMFAALVAFALAACSGAEMETGALIPGEETITLVNVETGDQRVVDAALFGGVDHEWDVVTTHATTLDGGSVEFTERDLARAPIGQAQQPLLLHAAHGVQEGGGPHCILWSSAQHCAFRWYSDASYTFVDQAPNWAVPGWNDWPQQSITILRSVAESAILSIEDDFGWNMTEVPQGGSYTTNGRIYVYLRQSHPSEVARVQLYKNCSHGYVNNYGKQYCSIQRADMVFFVDNVHADYYSCNTQGVDRAEQGYAIAKHEVGHWLGLGHAHSNKPDSIMAANISCNAKAGWAFFDNAEKDIVDDVSQGSVSTVTYY